MVLKSYAGLGLLQSQRSPSQTSCWLAHHDLLVLAAGFPCNSFTLLGAGKGEHDPKYGDLGGYVVKVAAAKRPVAVLLENVPMFFNGGRPWFRHMVAAFAEAGYDCSHSILSAWDFGLPQHRRRGLIVAVRKDVPGVPFMFPLPPRRAQVTLRSALLPADSVELLGSIKFRQDEVHMEWKQTRLPGSTWDEIVDKVPDTWRSPRGLINLGTVEGFGTKPCNQIYHDLGYHPCVTGLSVRQWIFTRGTEDEGPVVRRIHPLELRRIQGFPDDFELHHLKTITIKQLSNAVPPQMVEWVARAVAEQYREYFYEDEHNVAKTPGRRKSGRKSSRKSKGKSSRRRSRKRSRESTQKSRNKSSHSHASKGRHRSRDSHRSSRKRTLSSNSNETRPRKRHHRQPATSPDSQSRWSTGTTGFDDIVDASVSPGSQSRLSTGTEAVGGNVRASARRRHKK